MTMSKTKYVKMWNLLKLSDIITNKHEVHRSHLRTKTEMRMHV